MAKRLLYKDIHMTGICQHIYRHKVSLCTVNSEIFARTLFSRNFAYAKFRENKTLTKWQNHSVVY